MRINLLITMGVVTRAQLLAEQLPGARWAFHSSTSCDETELCTGSIDDIQRMKKCIEKCQPNGMDSGASLTLQLPRRSACKPTKDINMAGVTFELPADLGSASWTLASAMLTVDTFSLQRSPTYDKCEGALVLRRELVGEKDDVILGTLTQSICESRKWEYPLLSSSTRANPALGSFEFSINDKADLSVPRGIGVHAMDEWSCKGFSVNSLNLTFKY